jgi:hypothetical protein
MGLKLPDFDLQAGGWRLRVRSIDRPPFSRRHSRHFWVRFVDSPGRTPAQPPHASLIPEGSFTAYYLELFPPVRQPELRESLESCERNFVSKFYRIDTFLSNSTGFGNRAETRRHMYETLVRQCRGGSRDLRTRENSSMS